MKKIVIVDNYDSFTYNLSHMVKEIGADVTVLRNDCFEMSQLADADGVILSPGPGIPEEAGLLMDVIRTYAATKPMLGVCLGHQAIGEVFGAKLLNLTSVFHGVQTECRHIDSDELFASVPQTFDIGRYHSWVISEDGFPDCLEITARSNDGSIMAVKHKQYNVYGIQFHPESVLTPNGRTIVENWLKIC